MRRDLIICGIALTILGFVIFVISSGIGDNIPQCNGQILQLFTIACDTVAPFLAAVIGLATVIVIIGITLAIIGPLAPSKSVK
jgi:hypothetical protein